MAVGLVGKVTGFTDKEEEGNTVGHREPLLHLAGFTFPTSSQTTYYTVELKREGNTWTVEKRYSELLEFSESIEELVELQEGFPPKILGTLTQAQKEERQAGISKWVSELLRTRIARNVIAQVHNFLELSEHVQQFSSQTTLKHRRDYGSVIHEGWVTKLGGNKDDPYNMQKGTWHKRYMVLQDDLRYFESDRSYKKVTIGCPPPRVLQH